MTPVGVGGIGSSVRTLAPGGFALVMATGIVSIAMHAHHQYLISNLLLGIAAIAYVLLLIGNVARILLFRSDFHTDLADPEVSFTMFTFVAGTNVLGSRLLLDGHRTVALWLLAMGLVAWLVLGYLVPWSAVLDHPEGPALEHVNGTWFLWVVASQSVAVLAAGFKPVPDAGGRALVLIALLCWSVGVFLYAASGILVGARMLIYPVSAKELSPPYWIAMGATAITVLAGAGIVQMADTPLLAATRGLIAGVAVIFFGFGTWLIPVLVAAGIWRHLIRRMPMGYSPALWSVVFPLGMYGVAGYELGVADRLPALIVLGDVEGWIALVAWTLTFLAMIWHWLSVACARKGLHSNLFRAQASQEPR